MGSRSARHRGIRKGYRSGLELVFAQELEHLQVPFTYEAKVDRIKYVVPSVERTYTPDFCVTTKSGKKIYVETKGVWLADDRKKHLLIQQQHPDLDIRFVFQNAQKTLSKVSKTTYADICEGRGRAPFKTFRAKWFQCDKGTKTRPRNMMPREWLDE
jgi:predicted nuclease of restriction endonuclease-like RecB superfamily